VAFTAFHRGGAGEPLVLLHGFMDTWRTWELVLPALERRHDVLALTLPGHAGGPPLTELDDRTVPDAVERAMDDAGFATAHIAGNSLGGWIALQLAARGRARTVTAFAPGGGWADAAARPLLAHQAEIAAQTRASVAHADAIVATPRGRRQVTRDLTVNYEHIPAELLAHLIRAVAAADVDRMAAFAATYAWQLDAAAIACPVRIVWGTADALLPWPRAAERFRTRWLPHADWVVLDDVGHAPQLDVPVAAAQLILGHTAP
jgi:pimeloyl-ACP methyl ester carboxylesterase